MDYHRGLGIEVTYCSLLLKIYVTHLVMLNKIIDFLLFLYLYLYLICFALQARIARIFNTYGPRMCIDDGRVVSNFVAQVSNFLPIIYVI